MTTERIFIIGGTGNIGKKLVAELLSRKVAITLFARDPSKVAKLFSDDTNLAVVQGDLNDISPLKEALKGHTRLFAVFDPLQHSNLKGDIAKIAYGVGIKQIVDISSITASAIWRTSFLGVINRQGEQAMLDVPNRGTVVSLRPGRFMSNVFFVDGISPDGVIAGTTDESDTQGWISTNDIGVIAANILTEDVAKHGDVVYELVSQILTQGERAQVLSRVLGKEIRYQKVSAKARYEQLLSFGIPHQLVYDFVSPKLTVSGERKANDAIPILLGKEPETFEEFITSVKHLL